MGPWLKRWSVHITRLLKWRSKTSYTRRKSLEGTDISGRSTILFMGFSVVGHINLEWGIIAGATQVCV